MNAVDLLLVPATLQEQRLDRLLHALPEVIARAAVEAAGQQVLGGPEVFIRLPAPRLYAFSHVDADPLADDLAQEHASAPKLLGEFRVGQNVVVDVERPLERPQRRRQLVRDVGPRCAVPVIRHHQRSRSFPDECSANDPNRVISIGSIA